MAITMTAVPVTAAIPVAVAVAVAITAPVRCTGEERTEIGATRGTGFANQTLQLVSSAQQRDLQHLLTRPRKCVAQALDTHRHRHEIGSLQLEGMHSIFLARRHEDDRGRTFTRRQRLHEREARLITKLGAHERDVRNRRQRRPRRR